MRVIPPENKFVRTGSAASCGNSRSARISTSEPDAGVARTKMTLPKSELSLASSMSRGSEGFIGNSPNARRTPPGRRKDPPGEDEGGSFPGRPAGAAASKAELKASVLLSGPETADSANPGQRPRTLSGPSFRGRRRPAATAGQRPPLVTYLIRND